MTSADSVTIMQRVKSQDDILQDYFMLNHNNKYTRSCYTMASDKKGSRDMMLVWCFNII